MNDFFQNIREGDGIPDNVDFDNIKTIEFNKGNWTGEVGQVMIDGDTFTIKDIRSKYRIMFDKDSNPIITDLDNEMANTHGLLTTYKGQPRYIFSICGCIRSDLQPQVAFAKVLYNV